MAKWWQVSWKRVAITLVAIFAGLWILVDAVQLVSFQLMPWHVARDLSKDNPQLSKIPTTLPDQSLVRLNGTPIEVYGFSMDTPWQRIDRQRGFQSVSVWNFKDGANVLIMRGCDAPGIARLAQGDPRLVRLFGQEAIRTEFAMMTAEMYASPDEVKWWKLPRQNARMMTLAGLKGTLCHKYGTLYAISFGRMHGFQEGAPNSPPYRVMLNLFDPDDHRHEIWITGEEGRPLPLTQAQLNSMVASIRPDSHN